MPGDDATAYDRMVEFVSSMPAGDLAAAVQRQEGGIDGLLDGFFAGIARAFRPDRAGGQQATVQFDITTPEGVKRYALHVADRRCWVDRGPAPSPRSTLKLSLTDFLRLAAGTLNPLRALMTRKLRIEGDLLFLQQAVNWFEHPKA